MFTPLDVLDFSLIAFAWGFLLATLIVVSHTALRSRTTLKVVITGWDAQAVDRWLRNGGAKAIRRGAR